MDDRLKPEFLDELREIAADAAGPMLICGDFNQIYQAADKNNNRLNLRLMRRFRRALDDIAVDELFLHGRLYTWSNERRRPTMERIDRAFANMLWLEQFTNHHLKSLSSDYSDHAPLLLQLNTEPWATPRFRFEAFWVKVDGFDDFVRQAWDCDLTGVDDCRALDFKLRRTAQALKSWSMRNVGSVRLQLFMAREIIGQLDVAQETRTLSNDGVLLRDELKRHSLGLASLARTIARHRSRIC